MRVKASSMHSVVHCAVSAIASNAVALDIDALSEDVAKYKREKKQV